MCVKYILESINLHLCKGLEQIRRNVLVSDGISEQVFTNILLKTEPPPKVVKINAKSYKCNYIMWYLQQINKNPNLTSNVRA